MVNLRGQEGKGHIQFPAQGLHRRKVHPLSPVHMAHVQGECLHRKGDGVELPQGRQGRQQGHGVLAAGDPHGNAVPRLDHVVILHTTADIAENFIVHQGENLTFRAK